MGHGVISCVLDEFCCCDCKSDIDTLLGNINEFDETGKFVTYTTCGLKHIC